MNLSEMRDRVRTDLHDEDSAAYRWTDAELDRHIQRAVRDLSLAVPLEAKATLSATPGTATFLLAASRTSSRSRQSSTRWASTRLPTCGIRSG